MVPNYIPLLVMLALAVTTAAGILALTHILGPRKKTRIKHDVPYESGRDPSGDARLRFNVKFYLVAVTFVVFDLEIVYFYPWALTFRKSIAAGPSILWVMGVFAFILTLGLVYEWKKGALDWK
jgi:NADH-quinone oxidoreductase subunit A